MRSSAALQSRLSLAVTPPTVHAPDFAGDVREGLSAHPKYLRPMYFYDERGSQLFEQICELPEYYVTRTEHAILMQCAGEIARFSGGDMALVEFGSGSSTKTRLLIEALLARQGSLRYLPIDISSTILVESAHRLLTEYPRLTIQAHAAEYRAGIERLSDERLGRKIIVFMGSNLGNFDSLDALEFLGNIRRQMGNLDYFLMGNDLAKDEAVLIPAYDDAQGITAAFNLNILARINHELGGDFDTDAFTHLALYNRAKSRVEMHLKSLRHQDVTVRALSQVFRFGKGETIHTENSYKYSIGQLDTMFRATGLRLVRRWLDDRGWFSVNLLQAI